MGGVRTFVGRSVPIMSLVFCVGCPGGGGGGGTTIGPAIPRSRMVNDILFTLHGIEKIV